MVLVVSRLPVPAIPPLPFPRLKVTLERGVLPLPSERITFTAPAFLVQLVCTGTRFCNVIRNENGVSYSGYTPNRATHGYTQAPTLQVLAQEWNHVATG
ncbi:hypothetical protein CC2G_014526 [Coprinopsis cinerea AmutBmut pab1-1]|nr:hypothetical protein CC2G_014526 [Coprinopsis cinerea AmutBmut pab1-1]